MKTRRKRDLATLALVLLMAGAACASGTDASGTDVSGNDVSPSSAEPAAAAPAPETSEVALSQPGGAGSEPDSTVEPQETDLEELLRNVSFSIRGWETDFSKRSVDLLEIFSGGPPRDGIPPIDKPTFDTFDEADLWLEGQEPVQALQINGDARAYPLGILLWHEIVNDVVGGRPVAVTYCPLCNTAITFDATLPDGRVLDFGTSGNLRFSDLVMWDRQTESWWQQITGEAIVGELTGTRLKVIPAPIISWDEFKTAYPDGKVLSTNTGYNRDYGVTPYSGYDSGTPFLYRGPDDDRLRPTERVASVLMGDEAVAFPFSVLAQEPVVHYAIADQEIVVFYKKGTTSALDSAIIAYSKDVGATNVFLRMVDGQTLTFQARGEGFVDQETGSTWNLLGQAIAGPLTGAALEPVAHANHFWFAWAVFRPDTVVYRGAP